MQIGFPELWSEVPSDAIADFWLLTGLFPRSKVPHRDRWNTELDCGTQIPRIRMIVPPGKSDANPDDSPNPFNIPILDI
jgi:hypothetical protein